MCEEPHWLHGGAFAFAQHEYFCADHDDSAFALSQLKTNSGAPAVLPGAQAEWPNDSCVW